MDFFYIAGCLQADAKSTNKSVCHFFLTYGCASRESGVLNNFLSCKRHEVTYLLKTNSLRFW